MMMMRLAGHLKLLVAGLLRPAMGRFVQRTRLPTALGDQRKPSLTSTTWRSLSVMKVEAPALKFHQKNMGRKSGTLNHPTSWSDGPSSFNGYYIRNCFRFTCDRSLSNPVGKPKLMFSLPCRDVFDWKTKMVCYNVDHKSRTVSKGGNSLIIVICVILLTCGLSLFVYKHRRRYLTTLDNAFEQARRRLGRVSTVSLETDDHFLIRSDFQVPTFGSLNSHDDDDDELILA